MDSTAEVQARLEERRGKLVQWGTPDLRVRVITKDEPRGRIQGSLE
jgi:hypothetical protein